MLDCVTSLRNGADLLWIETAVPDLKDIASLVAAVREQVLHLVIIYNLLFILNIIVFIRVLLFLLLIILLLLFPPRCPLPSLCTTTAPPSTGL